MFMMIEEDALSFIFFDFLQCKYHEEGDTRYDWGKQESKKTNRVDPKQEIR